MSSSVSTVSDKGLVVIPKQIRQKYGLKKGSKVSFVDYGGTIYLFPAPEDPIAAARGMFKDGARVMEDFLADRQRERELEEERIRYWQEGSQK